MVRSILKFIVKARMLYADLRGHHGKKWNYEPGDWYMGNNKRKKAGKSRSKKNSTISAKAYKRNS